MAPVEEKKSNCDDCGRFSEKTAISRTAFLKQNTDRREKRRKLVQNRGKNIVTIIDLKTKVGMYHFLQNCSTVYGKNHGDRRLMPHTAVSKMTSFCTLRFHLHQHLN
jgi:recombinational DNA repair protein RecR